MFIPLYLELWHCIYHILLTVGAGGSGPGENSGHPGEDRGYAERASPDLEEKKTWIDPRILFLTFTIHMCVCTFVGEGRQAQLSVLGFISACLHERRWQLTMISALQFMKMGGMWMLPGRSAICVIFPVTDASWIVGGRTPATAQEEGSKPSLPYANEPPPACILLYSQTPRPPLRLVHCCHCRKWSP